MNKETEQYLSEMPIVDLVDAIGLMLCQRSIYSDDPLAKDLYDRYLSMELDFRRAHKEVFYDKEV